ncbi:MAG: hypothetical protein WBD87_00790 [Candidatus Acidiferrales bacterium]
MQQLKPLAELLQADPTNEFLGNISGLPVTLENIHATVSGIYLRANVPEDVRNYMESIKNLTVFGVLHYPFYTHAMFLATTALEMALRARFPIPGEDRRTMRPLIEEARKAGLVRDDCLPSSKRWHTDDPDLEQTESVAETSALPQQSYAEYAWRTMLNLRNKFLHRQQSTIMTAWMAIDFLSLAAEMINALFAESRTETR